MPAFYLLWRVIVAEEVKKKRVGRPRTKAPSKPATPQDGSKISERRSRAAKKTGLSGKVPLTPAQAKRKAQNQRKSALRPSEEAELRGLWESGEFTLRDLAEKYNRTPETLSRHFSIRGIVKGSKAEEFSKQVHEKILSELMGDAGETAKKLRAIKQDHMSKHEFIAKAAANEFAVARAKNLPLATVLPNLRALKEFQSILETCRKEQYTLLNAEEFESRIEQEDVPELIVSELTVEEIEEMRRKQRETAFDFGNDDDNDDAFDFDQDLQSKNEIITSE